MPAPSAEPERDDAEDFPTLLRNALRDRSMTAADLSREIQKEIPHFSPGNISHYLAGRSVPRNQVLGVMSRLLEVDLSHHKLIERKQARESEPAPPARDGGQDAPLPQLSVSDAGGGEAFVQINQQVPWPLAIKILQLFRGEG